MDSQSQLLHSQSEQSGVVVSALTKGLKIVVKGVGNGFKTLGSKVAGILQGLIGSIVSFIFKIAG